MSIPLKQATCMWSCLPTWENANLRRHVPHHVGRFLKPPPRQSARPRKVEGQRKPPRPCRRTLAPPCPSRANPTHLRLPMSPTFPQEHLRRRRVSKERGRFETSKKNYLQSSIRHARYAAYVLSRPWSLRKARKCWVGGDFGRTMLVCRFILRILPSSVLLVRPSLSLPYAERVSNRK